MTRMTVFLTEGFADWECALTMAAARGFYGFECQNISFDGAPVTSSGGLKVTPDRGLAGLTPDDFDILLICGGGQWESGEAPDLSHLLRTSHAQHKTIGAICAATRSLASAGLLDNLSHTSNGVDFLDTVENYRGKAHYADVPHAVHDQNIITAPGWAPVSFMREIMMTQGVDQAQLDYYIGLHASQHKVAA